MNQAHTVQQFIHKINLHDIDGIVDLLTKKPFDIIEKFSSPPASNQHSTR